MVRQTEVYSASEVQALHTHTRQQGLTHLRVYGKIILLLTLYHRSVNTLLTNLWSQLLGLSALQYGIMFIL